MKKILILCYCLGLGLLGYAQTDTTSSLLDLLGKEDEIIYAENAFKSPRVIMGHSMEMLGAGVLDFRILHRFGTVKEGISDMFGLDYASMRMGFDYGVTQNLTVGIGRSTFYKELDGYLKYRFLRQASGKKKMPFSVVWISGVTITTISDPFPFGIEATLARRTNHFHQVVVGRKFSERFTLQTTPTVLISTMNLNATESKQLWALGIGGRLKLSKRVAFVWDYFYTFNRSDNFVTNNPLSVGFDIDTGGHVFQLHFSNATGMNERAFLSEQNGDWTAREFRIGFNLSRVFQVRKNKI